MVKDGMYLMYIKGSVIYPVALTYEEHDLLQTLVKVFEPMQVINSPQGIAMNLNKEKENNNG